MLGMVMENLNITKKSVGCAIGDGRLTKFWSTNGSMVRN